MSTAARRLPPAILSRLYSLLPALGGKGLRLLATRKPQNPFHSPNLEIFTGGSFWPLWAGNLDGAYKES
jgi:hypothetical protein